jgi:hypothetical protein
MEIKKIQLKQLFPMYATWSLCPRGKTYIETVRDGEIDVPIGIEE